jgi:ABC-type nitrate/sulfonate/bicarbonate transport system permease component
MGKRLGKLLRRYPQPLTMVLSLVVWEACGRLAGVSWLPPASTVLARWWRLLLSGELAVLGGTLQTFLVGMLATLALAALLTAALASSRLLEEACGVFLNVMVTLPTVALVPVFMLVWGIGEVTRVMTVVFFALFPVVITWLAAVRDVPQPFLEMAHSFNAGRFRRLTLIILPAAAPLMLTGLRIGIVQGLKGVVSAEILIAVIGIGRTLRAAAASYEMDYLYAVILTLLGLSIISYFALDFLEHRASRWARE